MVKERCPGDNNWSPLSMNVLTENRIKVSGLGNVGYAFDIT